MQAETQSVQSQSAKARFDAAYEQQQRLRATLSAEEYESRRMQAVREFIEITQRSGEYAEAQGMTNCSPTSREPANRD
jgi:hypothetical protein